MARIDSGGLLFLYQFRGVTSDADSFVRSWAAQDPEAVADLEFELFWTLELAPKLLKAVSETIQSGDANRVTIVNLSDGTYEQTKLTQKCRPKRATRAGLAKRSATTSQYFMGGGYRDIQRNGG
jgi:hypothetical protein